jgi:2,4-dienoyl-CoA reductase-like NADH-dependent reductase (Old Yellow Enzyme family)
MEKRNIPGIFAPIHLGSLELPNRLVKSATYECPADDNGVPPDPLIRWHERIARGGVGLDIVAYGLVDPSGQSFLKQVRLDSDRPLAQLCKLTEAAHEAGGRVAIQLVLGAKCSSPPLGGALTVHKLLRHCVQRPRTPCARRGRGRRASIVISHQKLV